MATTMTASGAEFLLRVEVDFQEKTLYSAEGFGEFQPDVRMATQAEMAEAQRRFVLSVKTDFGNAELPGEVKE